MDALTDRLTRQWGPLCRGRDAYTNTVETERMREILRKELKVRTHETRCERVCGPG